MCCCGLHAGILSVFCWLFFFFFFSSRRRHTRCALVTGVQTCALPISVLDGGWGAGTAGADASEGWRGTIGTLNVEHAGLGVKEIGRASCRERVCQYV